MHINKEHIKSTFPESFKEVLSHFNDNIPSDASLLKEAIILDFRIDELKSTPNFKILQDTLLNETLVLIDRFNTNSFYEEEYTKKDTQLVKMNFLKRLDVASLCEVYNVSKKYKRSQFTLNRISLTIEANQIIGVLGENANGKTTLLKIIAGEIIPDEGYVKYPDIIPYNHPNFWSVVKENIAYIPQKIEDWDNLHTLKEHLHFFAAIKGIKGHENGIVVDFYIERLGLKKYQNLYWREISGGIQLRFEIAKAFLWEPHLIILDEPLANLDVLARAELLNNLRYIVNSLIFQKTSIIITSHNIYEVEYIADKVLFLEKGNMIYYGSVQSMGSKNKQHKFLLETTWSKETLMSVLKPHITEINDDDYCKTLTTPLSITQNQMLQLLIKNNVPFVSFRNITHSTRQFYNQNEL